MLSVSGNIVTALKKQSFTLTSLVPGKSTFRRNGGSRTHLCSQTLYFIWELHEIQALNLSLYYCWLVASSSVNIMLDSTGTK